MFWRVVVELMCQMSNRILKLLHLPIKGSRRCTVHSPFGKQSSRVLQKLGVIVRHLLPRHHETCGGSVKLIFE